VREIASELHYGGSSIGFGTSISIGIGISIGIDGSRSGGGGSMGMSGGKTPTLSWVAPTP
jgi:hypothetical protein